MMIRLSGLTTKELQLDEQEMVLTQYPLFRSQSLMVRSWPPENTLTESEEKHPVETFPVCPVKVCLYFFKKLSLLFQK